MFCVTPKFTFSSSNFRLYCFLINVDFIFSYAGSPCLKIDIFGSSQTRVCVCVQFVYCNNKQ
jgi:hypothetical protein